MTITRIDQFYPYQVVTVGEVGPVFAVDTAPFQGTLEEYTDGYEIQFSSTSEGLYLRHSAKLTQMRSNAFLSATNTNASTDTPGIFFLCNDNLGNDVLNVYYDADVGTVYAYAGATQLGSFTYWIEGGKWQSIGVDFKCDSASGWCYIYIDGTAMLSYSGKTDYGDTEFDFIGWGPLSNTYDGWSNMYLDSFYVDNTSGEVAAACPPSLWFVDMLPNGTGNYAQWYGSDQDQTNNYDLLDNNLSYSQMTSSGLIESQTSTHRDSWQIETPPLVSGATTIGALIAQLACTTRSTTDSVQIRAFCRYSGSDSDGDAFTPGIDIHNYFHRFTTDPAASAWTRTSLVSAEIGVKFE